MKRMVLVLVTIVVTAALAPAAWGQVALGGLYYATPFPLPYYGGVGGYGPAEVSPPVSVSPLPPSVAPMTPGSYYVVSDGMLRQYDVNYNLVKETRLPAYTPWPQGGATLVEVGQAGVCRWEASLSGLQSQGYTEASGSACFWLDSSGQGLHYAVTVVDLRNPTEISINLNDPNLPPTSAPAVARLYCCRPKPGRHTGVIARGTIRDCDLIGWLAGYRVSDLIQALNQGQGFVAVRTARYPQGELMGTIRVPAPTVVAQRQ